MSAGAAPAVASPCIGVCDIDERSGFCSGCHRTLDEIAAWSTLDDAGKRVVWSRLPARRWQARRQRAADETLKKEGG